MKAMLEFNLPEEQEEYEIAVKAWKHKHAITRIHQEIFRPHRKHGYSDEDLKKLCKNEKVLEAISVLEELFHKILEEEDINVY